MLYSVIKTVIIIPTAIVIITVIVGSIVIVIMIVISVFLIPYLYCLWCRHVFSFYDLESTDTGHAEPSYVYTTTIGYAPLFNNNKWTCYYQYCTD